MRSFISVEIERKDLLSKIHQFSKQIANTDADTNPVAKENLHITIKFLGEIDEERIPEIEQVIKQYVKDEKPFSLRLGGMGAFPSVKKPKVVWIGGQGRGNQRLKKLAKKIRKELERRGFRKDRHGYHTHVTLARVDWYTDELKELIAKHREVEIGKMPIEKIWIKKSELTSQGPIYTTLEEIPLGKE